MKSTQLNDYQQAKLVTETLKKGKQVTLLVTDAGVFRVGLTKMKGKKTFMTKKMGDNSILVIRVS